MNLNIIRLRRGLAVLAGGLLAAGLWSCSEEAVSPDDPGNEAGRYSIVLSTGPMSRAGTEAGENDDENRIGNWSVFFYRTGETTPVLCQSGTANSINLATVNIRLSLAQVEALFGSGSKCTAYALVNLPSEVKVDDAAKTIDGKLATIEEIEQTKVRFEFDAGLPSSFVMQGKSDDISFDKTDNRVSGQIDLKRVAAKIRMWVHIPEKIYVDESGRAYTEEEARGKITELGESAFADQVIEAGGMVCTPLLGSPSGENVKLYITNGVNRARIDGSTVENDVRWMEDEDYYSISRKESQSAQVRSLNVEGKETGAFAGLEHTHGRPIYTYPNHWTSSAEETHRSYLILLVNWDIKNKSTVEEGATLSQPSYYQVPINVRNGSNMESNKYYRIGLTVGMLGSTNFGEPQELESMTWEVLDWQEEDVNMSLNEGRYVVFSQADYVMNNEQTIEIPFTSSHEVEVKNVYVTYFRFNDTWGTTGNGTNNEFSSRRTAYNQLVGGEGLITNATYGDVYSWNGYYDGSYYEGRHHPKTIAESAKGRPANLTGDNLAAWNLYEDKYGISDLYVCKIENNRVVFNHPLVRWEEKRTDDASTMTRPAQYFVPVLNSTKTGFKDAYSRYDITIVIGFKNDVAEGTVNQRKTIHIVQYPAMYIEELNNAQKTTVANFSAGYVSVNKSSSTQVNTGQNNRNYNYGTVTNLTNSNNTNMNMYSITISRLSEDESALGYKIGDPRTLTKNINLSDASFTNTTTAATRWGNFNVGNYYYYGPQAGAKYYDGRQINASNANINDYYPADETAQGVAGTKYDMIAPKLRIASSWGATSTASISNKEVARRRCASYQEFGYPAGRWRLPTMAEVKFIVQLSADKIIPYLFGGSGNSDAYYYTAQGIIGVNNGATNENNRVVENPSNPTGTVVRCVYDDWYWVKPDGTEDRLPQNMWTTWTWGDKPKDNPQTD